MSGYSESLLDSGNGLIRSWRRRDSCLSPRETVFLTRNIRLGGKSIGTTRKGIGPSYAVRICGLSDLSFSLPFFSGQAILTRRHPDQGGPKWCSHLGDFQ